jgi:hypothetical protein
LYRYLGLDVLGISLLKPNQWCQKLHQCLIPPNKTGPFIVNHLLAVNLDGQVFPPYSQRRGDTENVAKTMVRTFHPKPLGVIDLVLIKSIQNQTRFQAPSGGRAQAPEYAAPMGLENWVVRVATKVSLLTELVGRVTPCAPWWRIREGWLQSAAGSGLPALPTATRLQHSAQRWRAAATLGERAK